MEIKQINTLLTQILNETIGTSEIITEDLSNVIDIGGTIEEKIGYDSFTTKLVDKIGRMIFETRTYQLQIPDIVKDSWEYGSIIEKVRMEIPTTYENDSWKLENGQEYCSEIFYRPDIKTKFYNHLDTFEIRMSITDLQVKSAFNNINQLNAFISMIYNKIDTASKIYLDNMILRTINNMIGHTIHTEYGEDELSSKSTNRGINVLKLYNDAYPNNTLTINNCLNTPDFHKFLSETVLQTSDKFETASNLFNLSGTTKFTPKEYQKLILLSPVKRKSDIYLQSDVYHNELTRLPKADIVNYWQGIGNNYSFENVSDIHVNIKVEDTTQEVIVSGVLGVLFDRDCLGINKNNERIKTSYSARGEFTTNYYKYDVNYFNDLDENFVVFFIA